MDAFTMVVLIVRIDSIGAPASALPRLLCARRSRCRAPAATDPAANAVPVPPGARMRAGSPME
ncbi:hypothetical protein [Sinimarinibacterium thermocellulolyticum]|uniref:Uncharacterized protein n=1 Tax=Sinimarinibacterium thermocellulolyticum TaxID=3170016 RepID=A0ABV2AAD4_9GAMM